MFKKKKRNTSGKPSAASHLGDAMRRFGDAETAAEIDRILSKRGSKPTLRQRLMPRG